MNPQLISYRAPTAVDAAQNRERPPCRTGTTASEATMPRSPDLPAAGAA